MTIFKKISILFFVSQCFFLLNTPQANAAIFTANRNWFSGTEPYRIRYFDVSIDKSQYAVGDTITASGMFYGVNCTWNEWDGTYACDTSLGSVVTDMSLNDAFGKKDFYPHVFQNRLQTSAGSSGTVTTTAVAATRYGTPLNYGVLDFYTNESVYDYTSGYNVIDLSTGYMRNEIHALIWQRRATTWVSNGSGGLQFYSLYPDPRDTQVKIGSIQYNISASPPTVNIYFSFLDSIKNSLGEMFAVIKSVDLVNSVFADTNTKEIAK